MIKVYHTSSIEVVSPDIFHSRNSLDFGAGFYITIHEDQARAYGQRFKRRGKKAVLNHYELDEDYKKHCRVKKFDNYDDEWLDFVVACRKELPHEEYDVVIGGIANDIVFNTINLFLEGLIDREETMRRLIYQKPNMQICINSQILIDEYLHFIKSEEL
ncbi:MAG: DUF3990 domain-containing protein [Bacteroidales bacterium]|nr:DUF3990 domain-containing protein [Bacteroidales bacterium]